MDVAGHKVPLHSLLGDITIHQKTHHEFMGKPTWMVKYLQKLNTNLLYLVVYPS
jgi:hypothetical protein